ncbi:Bacterial membrane flanked domain [Gemella morbillorum]|uniref:PH domain-containing protein n=1 Tax=Gemella morbillorum TaxID=29391 RepID=UPI000DA3A40A|nr:PH domain-containing protein [Gemella morbillorum]UBH81189.1 PH domain-containing protein [Gemella morbillorum]SQH54950.1 Bacterial membrane flanked domain [Gemella morbillorum]
MQIIFKKERYILPEKAKFYYKLDYLLRTIMAILTVLGIVSFRFFVLEKQLEYLLFSIIIGLIFIVGGICIWKIVPLKYENYSYSFDKEGITLVRGVFFKVKEFLPYNTIQDVTLEKGPILSKLNLANIKIKGINSVLTIDTIDEELAEEIKENILKERSLYNVEY